MLRAGRLRHKITIQQKKSVQDPDTGEMIESWTDVWTKVPAAIEPLSAREFIAAQAAQSEVKARITIRHRKGLDASMRILHQTSDGTVCYNIAGILRDNNSGREYSTLPVTEGVNEG